MAFGSFDRKNASQPMAEINMVPLIDVVLVLLVIFIVTAPLLTNAVKLDLPKASSTADIQKPEKVEFAIDGADPGGATQLYERVYLWVERYPSAVMRFLTFETSPEVTPPGEDVLALRMDARGHIEVYDGAEFEPENETTSEVPLGQWVRVEVMFDSTAGPHGQTQVRLFTGANVEGTDPDETVTIDHVASPGNPVTTAAFGVLNLVKVDYSLDAIEASTLTWVGSIDGA